VFTKLQTPTHYEDPLTIEETLRCDEFSRNNHKLFKYIKGLKAIQERRSGGGSVIFTNVEYVIQEVEKLHINRVKEIMISALNQEAIFLQTMQASSKQYHALNQDIDLAC
jgi:hypothetical protein